MSVQLNPDDLILLDPMDQRIVEFNWDTLNLPIGVTIASSTYTISRVRRAGVSSMSYDNNVVTTGNRRTQARLNANLGTVGDVYRVANAITTNESPPATKEVSIFVKIEKR